MKLPMAWGEVPRYLGEKAGMTEVPLLDSVEADGEEHVLIRCTVNGRTVVFRPDGELGRVLRGRLRLSGPTARRVPIERLSMMEGDNG